MGGAAVASGAGLIAIFVDAQYQREVTQHEELRHRPGNDWGVPYVRRRHEPLEDVCHAGYEPVCGSRIQHRVRILHRCSQGAPNNAMTEGGSVPQCELEDQRRQHHD